MDGTSSIGTPSSHSFTSVVLENGSTSTNTAKSSLAGLSISARKGGRSTWVRLNVGGRVFQTTRETLYRESGSFLARLCRDDEDLPSETDETGSYLIDRDPDYFSAVLNYLRHGRMVLDRGLSAEGLLEEAEFYNLPQLIHLCTERLNERHERDKKAKKSVTKQVYRVLQCHEDELTSVVSTISDGWKFEQLLGCSFHSAEPHPEYLCVVSRECSESEKAYANHEGSDRALFLQKKAMQN